MSFLELTGLSKTYPHTTSPVIADLSLDVNEGEIVVLLGPSGCGKTTLLKMIAGLETQDAGTIRIDGSDMNGVSAEKRPLAMVFQKALLFRNMTVEQNINFAPRVNRTMDKTALATKTAEMLRLIDMDGMGRKKATELSGGQEQRVSLARALMTNPKVLLLDEPFSALDAKLRITMRQHIRRLNRTLGITMIFVTHDQQEAVEVADRIALMQDGRILQYGKPADFYERPASREVADFFGWRNFIPATKSGDTVSSVLGTMDFAQCDTPDGLVDLAVRPEALSETGTGPLTGRVRAVAPQGVFSLVTLDCVRMASEPALDADDAAFGTGDTAYEANDAALGIRAQASSTTLDLLVKAADAPSEGETIRFGLSSRMMWPLPADFAESASPAAHETPSKDVTPHE